MPEKKQATILIAMTTSPFCTSRVPKLVKECLLWSFKKSSSDTKASSSSTAKALRHAEEMLTCQSLTSLLVHLAA